jgi:hypothetical protein
VAVYQADDGHLDVEVTRQEYRQSIEVVDGTPILEVAGPRAARRADSSSGTG